MSLHLSENLVKHLQTVRLATCHFIVVVVDSDWFSYMSNCKFSAVALLFYFCLFLL